MLRKSWEAPMKAPDILVDAQRQIASITICAQSFQKEGCK
jgi:hypothetical protein